jgi:restriction system protein
MKSYYRLMLGREGKYFDECFKGGFIGADFGINQDLKDRLSQDSTVFNAWLIPIYLNGHPNKTKIAAGLACGSLYTIGARIQVGDVVLCPDDEGRYHAGEVTGSYFYAPNGILPHRRPVRWLDW